MMARKKIAFKQENGTSDYTFSATNAFNYMGLSLEYKKTPCILERNSEKYFKDLDPDMNFHDLIRLDVIICE